MRNLSKQNQRFYQRFQPATLRHCTSQKRRSECKSPLKESQIRVGKYKFCIQDVLGKGYSSKVYKGVEIGKQHKKYAIKAVDLKRFKGSNMQMLDSQIQIHKSIDHQNIVKFHQVIKTPHHYYIILQYCPHGNLNDYINQKKKLSENNAVEIMEQVMSAYKYLLQQGVMHRDLKPANILRVGNKWKICDFGFSVKSRFQFKDRINVGTPLYMPMQALTRNYYSFKTDLYALGIILFEMLTGHTPWECRTQKQLLQKMRQQQLVLPKDIKNTQVKNFILKCCEMNQNKRFTIEQFKSFELRQSQSSSTSSSRKNNLLTSYLSLSNLKSYPKSRSSGATQESSTKSNQEASKQNTEILMNELNFCRHLYYMVVNIQSFLVQPTTKQMFILVVYKHLLRLIKTLQNKKFNTYNLKSWDSFKTSKTYHNLYLQFTQYSVRYEKQYLDYIKHIDIKSIRAVNRRFPELSHSAPLTQKFYTQLETYLTQIIRQQNHELSQINTKQTNELRDKIQALQSVYRYCKNLQAKKSQIQNCEVEGIIQIQKIKVIQNYSDSPICYNDYLNLRKILKSF